MEAIGFEAAELLDAAGVALGPGLSDAEFTSVHERCGFHFNPDHRSLLAAALPLGDGWPDWRSGDDSELTTWLDRVAEGFIWDALHQTPPFWPASWGELPATPEEVATTVRRQLGSWPRLIPIYQHRFTPAAPSPAGSPVLSVWQTDVIYYGADLVEYLRNAASCRPRPKGPLAHRRPRAVLVPVRRVGEQRRIGLTDGRSQTAGRSSPSVSLRAMS